jgi:hypothetical protein
LGGTNDPHPQPEEVEDLCQLLITVGKALDEGKAKFRMNRIYEALDRIRIHNNLEFRIKFKILDVLDLRNAGWIERPTKSPVLKKSRKNVLSDLEDHC